MIAGELPENDVIPGVSMALKAFLEDDEEGGCFPEDQKVEEVMHELLEEINGGSSGKNPGTIGASSSFPIIGERCGPAFSGSGSTLMAGIEIDCGSSSSGDNGGLEVSGLGVGGPTIEVFSGLDLGFSVKNGPLMRVEKGKGKDNEKAMQEGGRGKKGEEEGVVEGERMDGCDGEEGEDEWLTRVLNSAPQVLEDYLM